MEAKEIVKSIQTLRPAIEAEGATALLLYGSRARGHY